MQCRSIATRIALAAALAAAAGARLNAADDLPKAETILERYIEVTGGRAVYEKTHSEIATGSMEIAGMGIAVRSPSTRPSRIRISRKSKLQASASSWKGPTARWPGPCRRCRDRT